MSENIRKALESRLDAMTPALATAWENKQFTATVGVPYQRATMVPAEPDDSVIGTGRRFERGIFQVNLFYPAGDGPAAAQARAEAVRDWFKKGTSLSQGGVTTVIFRTPRKAPAFPDGDRYVVPISIPYQAEIFG